MQTVLQRVAEDARPAWQRSALLRGLEVVLLAAAMPGNPPPAPVDPNAPCPTCPGGRGESRGRNYAEMQEAAARGTPNPPPAAPPAGRGGGPRLQLNREPALIAVVARGGDLGTRAKNVLGRIEWPGKPGGTAVAAALSAAEQQRFTAGQEVYKNLCEACHGPDGREQQTAAGLAGSATVAGIAGVPIRVLLQGKDGAIGEMPAHGETLSDEQIASVLTFIRRSWGNSGTPVDATAVKEIRSATTGRTKPWTQEELSAVTR